MRLMQTEKAQDTGESLFTITDCFSSLVEYANVKLPNVELHIKNFTTRNNVHWVLI
uniref:Uncharacterized protein n=1 Tax=Anguilla anguilla TaxID=7936 RepID=A0A0E9WJF5_ANGAN